MPDEGHLKRECRICNAHDAAPSWLVTKSITAADSKRIHLSVTMLRSECDECRNQDIKVYILHEVLETDPSKAVRVLKKLPLLVNLSNEKNLTGSHDFYFEPKAPKFSIVFLSAGSCTRIRDITVSYFICEKNTSSLANLPETVAPASGLQRVNVSCPEKPRSASADGVKGYGLCSSEGVWQIVSPCMCQKGYTLNIKGECIGKLRSVLSCLIYYINYDKSFPYGPRRVHNGGGGGLIFIYSCSALLISIF